jgi:pyruvate kinase
MAGKPVIVATQMLESMVDSPYPTRAEATDVANAIFDGADAIMLSEETAIGRYPQDAVSVMAQIAMEAEAVLSYDEILAVKGKSLDPKTDDAISYSACYIARQLGAKAIIAFTTSGGTARRVARNRPRVPVLAITPNMTTRQRLLLSWGVYTFQVPVSDKMTDLFLKGAKVAKEHKFAGEGDLVIITGGVR